MKVYVVSYEFGRNDEVEGSGFWWYPNEDDAWTAYLEEQDIWKGYGFADVWCFPVEVTSLETATEEVNEVRDDLMSDAFTTHMRVL